MSTSTILEFSALLLTGILAGAEFLVCYGLHPALRVLPDLAHVQARQSVVRVLRVLVPAVMLPTIALSVIVAVIGNNEPGAVFRWAAVGAYLVFLLTASLGTVPINIRVDGWDTRNPPSNWKSEVKRWAQLDVLRSSAAILGFVCALIAAAARLG
jgi:uncharacterized membrane protein